MHDVFLTGAPIAFIGFLVVLMLREQPLRGRTERPRKEETPSQSSPLTPSKA